MIDLDNFFESDEELHVASHEGLILLLGVRRNIIESLRRKLDKSEEKNVQLNKELQACKYQQTRDGL